MLTRRCTCTHGHPHLYAHTYTHIRKHADASGVDIHLHDGGSELLMEIIDNGRGISEEQRDNPQSFGLRSMEERVAAIGGSLQIISRPGKGTMISARVPARRAC